MLRCRYSRALWGLFSGALLSGCVSQPGPAHPRGNRESTSIEPSGAVSTASLPEVDQNLVQAHAHYLQGMIYDLDEQPDSAQEELSKAALADPSNEDLVLQLTRTYLQQKQPEKAVDLLQRATAVSNASSALYARLALVYSRLGKNDQANAAGQTAIKRDPNLLEGYRVLFLLHVQQGHPKDALKVLDQAFKVPNTTPQFGIELVELYAALERQAPSEKVGIDANLHTLLNRISAQNPSTPQLRIQMADYYNLLGDTTNAARIYTGLIDAFAELPAARAEIRDKLARLYLLEKDTPKAMEQLQAIVRDDPANFRAYYLLGSLAEDDKKLAQAAEYLQKTILLNDDFEDAFYDLARIQVDLNQPREALTTLAKARGRFPDGFVPEILSALAYEKLNDFPSAIEHFTAAEVVGKTTDPKRLNGSFYFDQGAAYERAGDLESAERCFEKSLSLTPNFPEALNYLGYMWADHGIKLDKALELIEHAVKLEPKSAAYLDSLGWVLYKLNRAQEALPNLQKAIEFSEEPDATLYDHLGDIYTALHDSAKAQAAWTKSLGLAPNPDVRKKLEESAGKSGH